MKWRRPARGVRRSTRKIVFETIHATQAPRQKIDNSQAKQNNISNKRLSTKDKKKFMAVAKLEEKVGEKCKVDITPTGVLILRFESGMTMRDTGKEIFFNKSDNQARHMAEEYAKIRWGKVNHEHEKSRLKNRQLAHFSTSDAARRSLILAHFSEISV